MAEPQYVDFDAEIAELDNATPARTATVYGDTITFPPSLPLAFVLELRRQEQLPEHEQDHLHLAALLVGQGQVDRWVQAGMRLHDLGVFIAWAPHYIGGSDMTLTEAADKIAKAVAE